MCKNAFCDNVNRTCSIVVFYHESVNLPKNTTLAKETPTQVFSCEYREIFKNSFFYRTIPVAASASQILAGIYLLNVNNKDTRTTPLASFWCFYC